MRAIRSLITFLRLRFVVSLAVLSVSVAILELLFWYLLIPLLGGAPRIELNLSQGLSGEFLFLMVVLFRGFLFITNAWITNSILFNALTEVRTKIVKAVIGAPIEKYEKIGKVKLSNDIILNTQIAIDSVLTNILKLILNFTILAAIVIAFYILYGSKVFIVVIGIILILLLAIVFLMPKVRDWSKQIVRENNNVISNTDYLLQNIKEIKINAFSSLALDKIEKVFGRYSSIQTLIRFFQLLPKYLVETSVYFSIALFLYLKGGENFLVEISVLSLMAMRTLPLINEMIIAFNGLSAGRGGRDQLESSLLSLQTPSNNSFSYIEGLDSILRVRNLTFSFDDNQPLFKDLNITLNRGEIVGLIGDSGSGKSTLLDLILGIRIAKSGEVAINKSASVYYISQRPFVPEVSLFEYALEYSGRQDVWPDFVELLERFNIGFLADQKNLILNDSTLSLSGGQRQKIALAACLCSNSNLNILDEATSGMDIQSLRVVLETIQELRGNRTFLIVTHQHDFKLICDRVIKL